MKQSLLFLLLHSLILWQFAEADRIQHACQANGLPYVVHPQNVGAVQHAPGVRGQAALQAVALRQIERVPNKTFARNSQQDREAQFAQFVNMLEQE